MSYFPDNGRHVVYFDGQTGHLETFALDIHYKSFSLVCWVNIRDSYRMNHVYSDWSHPFQFRLYAFLGEICMELRGNAIFQVINNICG